MLYPENDNPYFIGLFYDVEHNRFIDEDGLIVWNVFEIVTPNDILLFKKGQEYMLVRHRLWKEVYVELFWPFEGEEYE